MHTYAKISWDMRRKNITVKDIARKLNLHHTTVSRALRNHPDVNSKTRARVLKTAKGLGYFPNVFAANLRNNRSSTIGVIVPVLHHDFFSSIVAEITNMAAAVGLSVLICQSNENINQELQNVNALISNRVAGMVASISQFSRNSDHFNRVMRLGIPLVFFDRVSDRTDASKVIIDYQLGAFDLVSHLISIGCTRIAHVGGPQQVVPAQLRFEGYKAALLKHGLPFREEYVIFGDFEAEYGLACARRLLSLPQKPDAIFAVNDQVALGVMIHLISEGIRIPEDIAIAGFDNDKVAQFTSPTLTSVDANSRQISRKVIDLLLRQINSIAATPVTEQVKPNLIVRQSTTRKDMQQIFS
jgi:DNA-binding LacI/PurR family transcriptional regulator